MILIYKVNEYPIVDGHHSMNIYIGALLSCWDTFDAKYKLRYGTPAPKYQNFSYFCFHTPFSKMVQKSYFSLLLHDIKQSHMRKETRYPQQLVQELAAGGFKNDQKNNEILNKHYGQEWKDKCERGLLLAK